MTEPTRDGTDADHGSQRTVAEPSLEPFPDIRAEPLLVRPRWYRRILRSAARWAAIAFVLLTMMSVPYNAYTSGRADPPPGLSYVTADGIRMPRGLRDLPERIDLADLRAQYALPDHGCNLAEQE